MIVDCTNIIRTRTGEAYAHEYDSYLAFFKELANADAPRTVVNAPPCWAPFILYLGHHVQSCEERWDCDVIDWANAYAEAIDKRRIVEVASGARPELVHALYCADTEWSCPLRYRSNERSFVVTCNGSFFRDEVRTYREKLARHEPAMRRAVLVPCAAAKPYPAPVHRAVMDRLPEGWDIVITTGVLGLIPRELWSSAPEYDSGMPNIDRVVQTVRWYFTKWPHEKVVVYSDFYAYAIKLGMSQVEHPPEVTYVFGNEFRDTYENTLLIENLQRLELAL